MSRALDEVTTGSSAAPEEKILSLAEAKELVAELVARTERLTLAKKALERIREVKADAHNPYYVHALNVSIALDSARQIATEALMKDADLERKPRT